MEVPEQQTAQSTVHTNSEELILFLDSASIFPGRVTGG